MVAQGDPSARDRASGWFVLGAVASIATFSTWIVAGIGGPRLTQAFDDIGSAAAPLVAALASAVAARRASGRLRRAWAFLSAGCLSWAVGGIVWTFYELVLGRDVPFPSFADFGYLGLIPFVTAGMLMFPSRRSLASKVRPLLDGLIVAGSLLFVSWMLILGPLVDAGGESALEQVIGLAYPAGDVVIAAVVIFVAAGARRGRTPLALLGAGLAFIAIADSGFAFFSLQDSYNTGNLIDIGWFAGFWLIAVAAVRPQTVLEEKEEHAQHIRILLPYLPLGVGVALTVHRFATGGSLDPFLIWNAIFVWVAVVARQFVTLFENLGLTHRLEGQVTTRTAEVRDRDDRIRSILDTANDAYVAMDASGLITAWNPKAEIVFGWPAEEAIGASLADTIIPERHRNAYRDGLVTFGRRSVPGNGAVEMTAYHRSGYEFPVEITIWSREQGDELSFYAFIRDITERKRFENELEHQALHDRLTGLANRTLFDDRVTHALQGRLRHRDAAGLIFLDLDNFKTVNDSLGHAAGDELLVGVAQRLAGCVRPQDTVGRLGGDEFAILIDGVVYEPAIRDVAERIVQALREPIDVAGRTVLVQASMGIAIGRPGEEASDLLRNAEVAMYKAKNSGKARYEMFEPSMHEGSLGRLELQSDLPFALERDQLFVVFQPVVDLETGAVEGFEALVRWLHPQRGLVTPAEFIPLAEETGFIVPLGAWVLEQACATGQAWSERHGHVSMAVNVSSRQVTDPAFADVVSAALAKTGFDPRQLVLEFTEGLVMRNTEQTLALLEQLHAIGVRLAVDDFGTGYSSLGYLERFPLDILKIDKSFVRGRLGDEDSALARAIVKIASMLRLEVIAEGIENPEQALALATFGCRYGQGYLFSPPLEFASAEDLLSESRHTSVPGISEPRIEARS